jgi:hypothetical protein
MSAQAWIELVLGVWLLLLTAAFLGLARQTSDLFSAIRTGRSPKTGERLLVHAPVSDEVLGALGQRFAEADASAVNEDHVVIHLSANCAGCLQAADSIAAAARSQRSLATGILENTVCLVTGKDGNKSRLLEILGDAKIPIIVDPQARQIVAKLAVTVSPIAVVIRNKRIEGWTELGDFGRLETLVRRNMEVRNQDDRSGPGTDSSSERNVARLAARNPN